MGELGLMAKPRGRVRGGVSAMLECALVSRLSDLDSWPCHPDTEEEGAEVRLAGGQGSERRDEWRAKQCGRDHCPLDVCKRRNGPGLGGGLDVSVAGSRRPLFDSLSYDNTCQLPGCADLGRGREVRLRVVEGSEQVGDK